MDLQLKGRTALVTGSGKGIGEAIAARLAEEGAAVIVHGRDRARADGVAAGIVARGGQALVVCGDLADEDAVRRLVDDAPWAEVERAVLPLFAQVPLRRVGRLDEIADAVAFLASPRAGYITGTDVRVDGGLAPSL